MQVSNGGSPEDAVGGGEIEAAPVHLLHVAHTHVNEGNSDAQMVLLAGRWEGVRARPGGVGLEVRDMAERREWWYFRD